MHLQRLCAAQYFYIALPGHWRGFKRDSAVTYFQSGDARICQEPFVLACKKRTASLAGQALAQADPLCLSLILVRSHDTASLI